MSFCDGTYVLIVQRGKFPSLSPRHPIAPGLVDGATLDLDELLGMLPRVVEVDQSPSDLPHLPPFLKGVEEETPAEGIEWISVELGILG